MAIGLATASAAQRQAGHRIDTAPSPNRKEPGLVSGVATASSADR